MHAQQPYPVLVGPAIRRLNLDTKFMPENVKRLFAYLQGNLPKETVFDTSFTMHELRIAVSAANSEIAYHFEDILGQLKNKASDCNVTILYPNYISHRVKHIWGTYGMLTITHEPRERLIKILQAARVEIKYMLEELDRLRRDLMTYYNLKWVGKPQPYTHYPNQRPPEPDPNVDPRLDPH